MKLKYLFLKWAYNDTNSSFFIENKGKISQLNMWALNMVNNVAVFIFGAFCIYSTVIFDFANLFRTYLFYFIIFLIINLLCRYVQRTNYLVPDHALYFIISILYIFGIYIGCFNLPSLAAVMFPVFLICLPLMFVLPTIKITFFNLLFTFIFIVSSRKLKMDSIAFIDQTNIIACLVISAVTSYSVSCARIKEMIATVKLEHACNTDELTQLHNRRNFNTFIVDVFERTPANRLTLMMIDIDNFKDYNDSYGHISGDHCLTVISSVFKEFEEKYGFYISRYGGEEFVLVDSTHTFQESINIAKELMQTISDSNIDNMKSYYKKITISIGISSKSIQNVTSHIDLINLADDALYQAKNNGKNKLMIASHSPYGMRLID